MQIILGGQNELTFVTLSQNSGKVTKIRQNEHFLAISAFKHLVAFTLTLKKSFFAENCNFLRVTKEITSMTRSQHVGKITQFRQSEHIFGSFCHQATSCIHSYPKTIKVCRKKSNFLVGQNELALMTLSRNSEKFTKLRQIEHMFVNFRLQASSPVRSYPIIANYCRKLQFFLGGWKELTLMTLSRNNEKITKVLQSEHIFVNPSLEASSFIHSYAKIFKFCWKVQIFLGGQSELTLMTLSQNSRTNIEIVRMNTFLAVSAFRHLVAPIATQNSQFLSERANFS